MTPVTALLTAIERHDSAALNTLLEHDGMTDEHLTCDEAAALWDAAHDAWAAPRRLESPQLWHITLGQFLRVLHATFPALPGAPAWAARQDVEEE